ncbi:MAG TPA: FkbM family methyltransferase [Niastella sp.]
MFSKLRIQAIKVIINTIEKFTFEKTLRKYYKGIFGSNINLVIDVGSNKGQTIDFFLKINPDCNIYGFEPNPGLYNYLVKKYEHLNNIRLFNMGVSSETGELIFNENVLNHTSTFENLNKDSAFLKKKAKILGVTVDNIIKNSYPVKTIALSEFIQSNIKSDIDILKIDTEGHEYSCLLGLFNNKLNIPIKYLQLESHNDDMYQNASSNQEIGTLLQQNNFKLVNKIAHRIGDFDELIYKNNKV